MLRRPFTLTELTPLAANAGVTRSVVIQTVNEMWETRDLLALAAGIDTYGDPHSKADAGGLLAGVVGWVDVAAPGVKDAVDELRSGPGGSFLCGIRHPLLDEADPDWLIRPEVLRGLRHLGESGLCFDVIALPHHFDAAVTAASSVPELRFVLEHMGTPPVGTRARAGDGAWESMVHRLGDLSNVTCKLSGMHGPSAHAGTLRPSYHAVLDAFGPDRLMFGSDWPVSSLRAPYGDVCHMYQELTADLADAERDAVMEHTARRVYGL